MGMNELTIKELGSDEVQCHLPLDGALNQLILAPHTIGLAVGSPENSGVISRKNIHD